MPPPRLVPAILVLAAAGCAGAAGPARPVAPGTWEFQGTGDAVAEFVFRVRVKRPRDGVQEAALEGIVGGGNIFRVRAHGGGTDAERASAPVPPGEHRPAEFRWDVEAQTLEGRHVTATVEVVLPRLRPGTDPLDPMSPGWEEFSEDQGYGLVRLDGKVRTVTGTPPTREESVLPEEGLPPAFLPPGSSGKPLPR